jgi:hypothetical protein
LVASLEAEVSAVDTGHKALIHGLEERLRVFRECGESSHTVDNIKERRCRNSLLQRHAAELSRLLSIADLLCSANHNGFRHILRKLDRCSSLRLRRAARHCFDRVDSRSFVTDRVAGGKFDAMRDVLAGRDGPAALRRPVAPAVSSLAADPAVG